MKAVILAGGLGTRLSEETTIRPKPMVEIGGMPILWHIMKLYSAHGIKDFVICAGYKGHMINEFFASYRLRHQAITFDLGDGTTTLHGSQGEDWRVTVVDTGAESMTGGRLKRVRPYLDEDTFCMTYGDGVSDIDISQLIRFHQQEGRAATMTVVQPPGRFGAVVLGERDTGIEHFMEKPSGDGSWVNGGFFVLEPAVFDFIEGDHTVWEQDPLRELARNGQLTAYRHEGFWQPMDTLRDKHELETRWLEGNRSWSATP